MPTSIEEDRIEKIRSDIIQYITGGEVSRELIFQIEHIKINNPELNEILVLLHSEYNTQSKKDKKMISKMISDLLALDFRNTQSILKLERELQGLINKIEKLHNVCLEDKVFNNKPTQSQNKKESETLSDAISKQSIFKNYAILVGASIILFITVYLFSPEHGERLAKDVVSIIKAVKGTSNDGAN